MEYALKLVSYSYSVWGITDLGGSAIVAYAK